MFLFPAAWPMSPSCSAPAGDPLYLGGSFELVHGGVISGLAGSSLGSTNEIGKGLGHVFDGVYQYHLKEQESGEWGMTFTADCRQGARMREGGVSGSAAS